MITSSDLRELASFTATRSPVVSLYLDTDLTQHLKDEIKLLLRDCLAKAQEEGGAEEDLKRISRYLDLEYDWQGRGLVIFSCQAEGLWEVSRLAVPLPRSSAYVGDKAYLMPLSNLLDRYAPYAVALVDQEGARIFLVGMGAVVKEENAVGEPIKRHKQGGWSAARFQRHMDKHADDNLRAAAEAMARFCEGNHCAKVILAGTGENTARFGEILPAPLRRAVVGAMPLDATAGVREVVERSRQILDDLEFERQRDLVDRTITFARSGGAALLGLADTLFALQEGRVMTLLIEDGLAAPGFACATCDYLSVNEMQHCLFCGPAKARPVRNVVERAVHKASLQGAAVAIIAPGTALAGMGHIGALLRY